MCLAIPMKILEVSENIARVELDGVVHDVRVDLLTDVKPGHYVLVHAGMAIEQVDPEEAEETLRLIRMVNHEIPQ